MLEKRTLSLEESRDEELKLSELIPNYFANKTEMDSYKKLAERDNREIKVVMIGLGLTKYAVGGITVSCNISHVEKFIERALIEKLKELNVRDVIKKREYVDMEALENAIYHGELNASELASCQEIKEIISLRISNKEER